jgi:hypothetical protein
MPVSVQKSDPFSILICRKKIINTFSIVSARFIPANRYALLNSKLNKNEKEHSDT